MDRSVLWGAQTPQTFHFPLLRRAYETAISEGFVGTDEAMLVERLGTKVKVVEGDYRNIKITTPEDLTIAEAIAGSWGS
jgi:2-C-methyl-D-erythritol 4-phosphate cytidylyltransferase